MREEKFFREIITKAVCGKGKKYSKETHRVKPSEKPSSILGCWIINHNYDAERKGDSIDINGNYDINVWYSYDDNTKTDVATDRVTYQEKIPLTMKEKEVMSDDLDVIARATKQPNTLEAAISEDKVDVTVDVEREFAVEVVGEVKMTVEDHPNEEDDDYKDVNWDEQVSDEELKEIEPDFLETDDED